MLAAVRVAVVRYLCDRRFVRWRRTNRNNRIARKWRKRYGAVVACRQEKVFEMGGMLFVCPCLGARLVTEMKLTRTEHG